MYQDRTQTEAPKHRTQKREVRGSSCSKVWLFSRIFGLAFYMHVIVQVGQSPPPPWRKRALRNPGTSEKT